MTHYNDRTVCQCMYTVYAVWLQASIAAKQEPYMTLTFKFTVGFQQVVQCRDKRVTLLLLLFLLHCGTEVLKIRQLALKENSLARSSFLLDSTEQEASEVLRVIVKVLKCSLCCKFRRKYHGVLSCLDLNTRAFIIIYSSETLSLAFFSPCKCATWPLN